MVGLLRATYGYVAFPSPAYVTSHDAVHVDSRVRDNEVRLLTKPQIFLYAQHARRREHHETLSVHVMRIIVTIIQLIGFT